MNRKELIRETAKNSGYAIGVCDEIIREMWDIMSGELAAHGEITIPRFGVFKVRELPPRVINLPDGSTIQKDARMAPKFAPSQHLREVIMS